MKTGALKLALLFIITLAVLGLTCGLLAYKNTLIALGAWNQSNKMMIFLKVDANELQKNELIEKIKNFSEVSSVNLTDRKAAGEGFQKSLKEYSNGLITQDELMDLVPETLEVDLKTGFSLQQRDEIFATIATQLKTISLVDEITYSAAWIKKFESIDQFIRSIGMIVFILVLILISYVISLMLKVYIEESKTEIEVYNLLGATSWSIYKLYLKDLFLFLGISLCSSAFSSFFIYTYLKKVLSASGLAKIYIENFQYLNFEEFLKLTVLTTGIITVHSFLTIRTSVNKLNQINND